jgi:hypothetical protein
MLAPHLDGATRSAALKVALEIWETWTLSEALTTLAPQLDRNQLVEAVLEILNPYRCSQYSKYCSKALAALAPYLDEAAWEAVHREIQGIEDSYSRDLTMSVLNSLPKKEAQEEDHSVVPAVGHPEAQVQTSPWEPEMSVTEWLDRARRATDDLDLLPLFMLTGPFVGHLDKTESCAALELARRIRSPRFRAPALEGLASYLDKSVHEAALRECLEVARCIGDLETRVEMLAELTHHLDESMRSMALEAARGIQDPWSRTRLLAELASPLQDKETRNALMREALDAALGINFEGARGPALSRLAPHMDDESLRSEALEAARRIYDLETRAKTLAALATYRDKETQDEVMREALEAARGINRSDLRSLAMIELAPLLPEAAREAYEAIQDIKNPEARAQDTAAVAPYLDPTLQKRAASEVFEVARNYRGSFKEYKLAIVAAQCAPYMEDAAGVGYEAAKRTSSPQGRAEALTALAPHLAEAAREALNATRGIEDLGERVRTTVALTSHLQAEEKRRALALLGNDWTIWLHHEATGKRDSLINNLTNMLGAIKFLGATEAMQELARSIVVVGRWWP